VSADVGYTIKEGANRPPLVVDLFDRFGTPQQTPLQGLDADGVTITFVFRHSERDVTAAADLIRTGVNFVNPDDPTTYQAAAAFLWETGETADLGAGKINFEVEIQWAPGVTEKFPNKGYFEFTIEEDLRGD
jgi:hypothetical protein